MPKMNEDLTPEQKEILFNKGTETPFSGKYLTPDGKKGTFNCQVCDTPLFSSDAHEDAAHNSPGLQGWPSFNDALPGAVKFEQDTSHGMNRMEVVCATCNCHLGHFFDADDTKTGKHYCLNSVCLDFKENN